MKSFTISSSGIYVPLVDQKTLHNKKYLMKNSKINCRATINRFILLSLTLCYISTAYCSNKEQEIKQFLIYDAMSYIGKPDLSYYGLQPDLSNV